MSSGSVRWPGPDGSGGLDLSPRPDGANGPDSASTTAFDAGHVSSPAEEVTSDVAAPVKEPRTSDGDATRDHKVQVASEETHMMQASEAQGQARVHHNEPAQQAYQSDPGLWRQSSAPGGAVAAGGPSSGPGAIEAQRNPADANARADRRVRRTRKARLRLSRVDPWSVMKTSFLFSLAFGIMTVVATAALWTLLAGSGALESLQNMAVQLFGDGSEGEGGLPFTISEVLTTSRIVGASAFVSAINVVLLTALSTLFAFLYNLAATLMGGLEMTLAED